jgi:O-antigen chain-terminating methyltransferase
MAFLSLANKKLASGGFIYLETPNPLCLESLSRFYTDPTHQRPIQPFQLSFLLEYNYFKKLKLLFLEPVRTRGTLSSERWITLYQDYGVLASKV